MKIHLKNFGILNDAEIDLSKDLLVLCGPNNTGKTYAAYAVYGAIKCITKAHNNDTEYGAIISSEEYLNIQKYIARIIKIDGNTVRFTINPSVIEDVIPIVIEDMNLIMSKILASVFVGIGSISSDAAIVLGINIDDYIKAINTEEFSFSAGPHKLTKKAESTEFVLSMKDGELGKNKIFEVATIHIAVFFAYAYHKSQFQSVIFQTAERAAISVFSKELALKRNKLVDELLSLNDKGQKDKVISTLNSRANRYPLPITDGLIIAEDLANISKEVSDYAEFAIELEDLIGGNILVNKDTGEMTYSTGMVVLSMQLSSSMVKSLAALVFYLRHQAQKGDLLIIDEPELNLHPDNQRKLARFLVKLTQNGIKVMLSTHSDYILREINNCIMLADDKEDTSEQSSKKADLREKWKFSKDMTINRERVFVGLFMGDQGGFQQLEVDREGFSINTIEKEINNSIEMTDDIYFSLYG